MPLHPPSPNRRPLATLATAFAALLTLTLAACGGEAAADPDLTATATETAPPIEATPTAASPPDRLTDRPANGVPAFPEEITTCLAGRGYDDPTAAGARDAEFQTALQDCATETGADLPVRAGRGSADGDRPGLDPTTLLECLAAEGIDVDPDATDIPLNTLDRAAPEVAAALESCGLPTGAPGPAQ